MDRHRETIGVVLLNLGGPDSLQAVRPFLYNLFSDREIIRLGPPLFQKPAAWLISSLRSKKTEEIYSLIGGRSPMLDITMAQADALEKALNQSTEVRSQETSVSPAEPSGVRSQRKKIEDEKSQPLNFSASQPRSFLLKSDFSFKVYIGMRYWRPFIKDTVDKILKDGIKHLTVLSLYPHYSRATTGSSVSEFERTIKGRLQTQYITEWHNFPPYIDALAELISRGISEFNEFRDKKEVEVLYSAHSLPESFIREGDPYLEHIKGTIAGVHKRLSESPYNITGLKWHLSFQSKNGPVKWLQPSTDEVIIKLADDCCKNLFVVPIRFIADHIETLYEIDILYKELAIRHGINFKRCRSLNTSEKFITALKELVMLKIRTDNRKL